jgi:hypothetical protein
VRRAGLVLVALLGSTTARAQSPEIALREFASGQIKKGVRSIGFGGDGATWGNYSLVYRDASTALVDGGATIYDNGNTFGFSAVGVTLPPLAHGLTIYAIALAQTATDIKLALLDRNLAPAPLPALGDGGNEAFFVKMALPLPHDFAFGLMLAYEVSHFDAVVAGNRGSIRYRTEWRPSGGFGVTWQPSSRLLVGTRVILNHDWELRSDRYGVESGLARSYEFRLGLSGSPWPGALLDAGGTLLWRVNALSGTDAVVGGANLGFEQAFLRRAIVVRAGVDECTLGFPGACTATAGLSLKHGPLNLDVAYLYDLGKERIGPLFGLHSHSILATLTVDYAKLLRR